MIYFGIFLYLGFLAFYYDYAHAKRARSFNYVMAFLLLVGLSGFRYKVGGDTYNYMHMHDFMPNLSDLFDNDLGIEKLQPLWLLLSATAKSIGNDFFILQLMHAFIVNGVIFLHIRNATTARFSIIFCYYFTLYPYFNFEILRESLAISFFLLSIKQYNNSQWIRYYLLATVAFLFHFSAIFLFGLPLIKNVKAKPYLIILLFTVSIIINPYFLTLLASSVLTENFFSAAGEYIEYKYTIFGLASLLLMYIIYPTALYKLSVATSTHSKYHELAKKAIIIGAVTPLFFIFFRFLNYFSLIFVIIFAESIQNINRIKRIRLIRPIIVIIAFIAFMVFNTARFFSDTSELAESSRWYQRWVPYHSIFDPVSDPVREQMIENSRP